MLTTAIPDYGL